MLGTGAGAQGSVSPHGAAWGHKRITEAVTMLRNLLLSWKLWRVYKGLVSRTLILAVF